MYILGLVYPVLFVLRCYGGTVVVVVDAGGGDRGWRLGCRSGGGYGRWRARGRGTDDWRGKGEGG